MVVLAREPAPLGPATQPADARGGVDGPDGALSDVPPEHGKRIETIEQAVVSSAAAAREVGHGDVGRQAPGERRMGGAGLLVGLLARASATARLRGAGMEDPAWKETRNG